MHLRSIGFLRVDRTGAPPDCRQPRRPPEGRLHRAVHLAPLRYPDATFDCQPRRSRPYLPAGRWSNNGMMSWRTLAGLRPASLGSRRGSTGDVVTELPREGVAVQVRVSGVGRVPVERVNDHRLPTCTSRSRRGRKPGARLSTLATIFGAGQLAAPDRMTWRAVSAPLTCRTATG